MSWVTLSPIAFGVLLWLLIVFQALTGFRKIRFASPKIRLRVHRTTAWVLLVGGPLHGLLASSVYLGIPFRIG